MHLVFILRLFALKLDVQRDLVRLINNVAMTAGHLSDVEMHNTGDRLQVFLGGRDQLIRSVGSTWVGPKDHYVREHPAIYDEKLGQRNPSTQGSL